jgi:glycosyltransferase involved in cell wall biosynthesis
VTFQGYVLPQELQRYYLEASVFVMSSLWPEPFGMVGPEAMRAGLPVVAFDAGAIGEWLQDGENGFLVPWGDTAMFAKRVQQLLCDKALARKLGERGRESVQRWDAGRHIAAMEKLLERVCRAASFTTPGCRAPAQLSPIAI